MKFNKIVTLAIIISLLLIGIIAVVLSGQNNPALFGLRSQNETTNPIRIGYFTTWGDSGYPAEVLKNTNILSQNSSSAEFIPFTLGPPMVEAALSNNIDALFIGRTPAINLLTKSSDWVIVGRLAYFPEGIMARTNSGITNIIDLNGRSFGVPYATGPYPIVYNALLDVGLTPGKDVTLVNIKPTDFATALETKQVDAVAWGEPVISTLMQKNLAYELKEYDDLAVVIVSKDYLAKHPENVKALLKSINEANLFFSKNKEEVFKWFAKDSRFDLSLVKSFKYTEPNYDANYIGDVSLSINEFWVQDTQKLIDFEFREGIIDKQINFIDYVDLNFLK